MGISTLIKLLGHYKCPECGSNEMTCFCSKVNIGTANDGQLKISDINVEYVLGCDKCSETVEIFSGEKVAEWINDMIRGEKEK